LRMSALAPDIELGLRGRCVVPQDRRDLIEWVQDPEHLDLVTEAFRRVCSGFVSTARLFGIHAGPFYMDWSAVASMLKTGYDSVYGASMFMEISGKGRLSEECDKLERALELIKEVQDSVLLADMLASLPSPSERMGQEVQE